MIQGVEIKKLAKHCDERGFLMEILRSDDPIFQNFSMTYVSMNYPGVIRAWHYHRLQDDHFCVLSGMCKVVLYDGREDSGTCGEINEFFMGEDNPILVKIPVGVLHGYKTSGVKPSFLLNFPTRLYNYKEPDEYRVPYDDPSIPYSWEIKIT
ncbi:MAG TPA: dTDP-4-dehydrorhamnose 3,5-epimerase family protein [Thermoanaerobaculia bacterium]|mgnify:CR=1 FL=1|nr:dTDP-4-dehydrorhamnose 3,5-epimerase family protein [Thermoanaerobaculia bacterium]HUM30539.1 dTDP-4-dehydrorhamnose 3,5-epimerase family protein [Thermoanaerobaculia bacterium]HXK68731.1 dTDP-4-dehydrorhamnose 3,5-epimerase family protein [Thermoanaerobaculia bacterium]